MPPWLCCACAMQYPESAEPPPVCPVCEDERQYVPAEGQRWTTLDELRAEHRADIREAEARLIGIGMDPPFAIGQRALHVRGAGVHVLWDCIPLLDDDIARHVESLGGIDAIAISHPHYYSAMVEWADEFDARILLHAADREWALRPSPRIEFWEGEIHELEPGLTLVRCGGHFEGGQVLHWAAGAEGRGVLLSGDIVMVVPDRRFVSFMRSYPNLIPLPASEVLRVAGALEPFDFERIYGAWWDRVVPEGGKAAVKRSAERYVQAIRSE